MEVSEILDRINILDYIGQYIPDLVQKGREWWGLSCFTDEKTPSFSIDPDKGYWQDFSSGKGGNLVEFVINHDHVSVGEAVAILKRYANINDEQDSQYSQRLDVTKIARKYRSQNRKPPQTKAKPLSKDIMQQFEFRKDKLQQWVDEGISWDSLVRHEVRYDAFDDRIVYPIKDYSGNIISICGRTCNPDYKALGIRKYTYKERIGALDTLYGFSDNREFILSEKEVIIFEGAKSCMKMFDWGYMNTAALLTSHLSLNQFKFLIQLCSFHSVSVVFALDADIDIKEDQNIKKLKSYGKVYWVKNRDNILPPKNSPVDCGRAAWEYLYANRIQLE